MLEKIGQKGFSKRTLAEKGNGLGVYAAKQSLQEVGGSIHFESEVGKGTLVTIEFPIEKEMNASNVDFVLIDNEELNHMMWRFCAKETNHKGLHYSSMNDFLLHQSDLERSTPIFIDSDLGDGKRGEVLAQSIRELGFKKLILATSYKGLKAIPINGLDAVIGKDFEEALEYLKTSSSAFPEADAVRC